MNTKRASGFSLIEVMVAVVVLSVLVVGSAAIIYQAGGTIAIQNNRRAAISVASGRLEQLDGMLYEDIRSNSGGSYYITLSGDKVSSAPDEMVLINGRNRPVVVEAQTVFLTFPDREFVRVEARVQYRSGVPWLTLSTNIR